MTLHRFVVSRRGVLHVGDRLVSRLESDRTGVTRRFDHDVLANKTIVYLATDALLSIGYSGLAYVGEQSTDDWIAGLLAGETEKLPDGCLFTSGSRPALDLGRASMALARGVAEATRGLPDHRGVEIVLAGWQWKRRHMAQARPFLWRIGAKSGQTAFRKTPRHFHRVGLDTLPACSRAVEELSALAEPIGHATTMEEVQGILVESVRDVALDPDRGVGPHCMSVFIPHPSAGRVEIEYLSPMTSERVILVANRSGSVPVAFSPWIVIGNFMLAPSLGAWSADPVQIGPLQIYFKTAVGNVPGLAMALSPQQRPRPPS